MHPSEVNIAQWLLPRRGAVARPNRNEQGLPVAVGPTQATAAGVREAVAVRPAPYPIAVFVATLYLLGSACSGLAAMVTNYLATQTWQAYSMAIDAGDTVVWVNQQPSTINYVQSYGGKWQSPPLNYGDSFALTFTNAGFFAYKTGVCCYQANSGVIVVRQPTNAAALSINLPTEGFIVTPRYPVHMQASPTNPTQVSQVQFFANSNLIATAPGPNFAADWNNAPAGNYQLQATFEDQQGTTRWSDPVNFSVSSFPHLFSPCILPTGQILFYCNDVSTCCYTALGSTDNLSSNQWTFRLSYWSPGIFVDESNSASGSRFYRILGIGK